MLNARAAPISGAGRGLVRKQRVTQELSRNAVKTSTVKNLTPVATVLRVL